MATIQYVVNAIDNASGTFAKIAGSADTLQSQLDDLNKKFTATVALDGAEKVKFQLGDLGIKLARLNTRVTPEINSSQITRALIQVAALNLALDRLGGGSGGGAFGRGGARGGVQDLIGKGALSLGGGGTVAGLGTVAAGGVPLLGATIPAAAVAPVAAAAAGGVALAFPALASGAVALASFAGFAKMATAEFTKLNTAVTTGGAAWRALSPAEKVVGEAQKALNVQFAALQKAINPLALQLYADGLHIVKDLMPAIRPLLLAAGTAADTFANKLTNWLTSPSGEKFVAWLQRDGPKAIAVLGGAFWWLANAFGRTIDFLYNTGETGLRHIRIFVHDAAGFIDFLRESWINTGHAIEHAWDLMWTNVVVRIQRGIAEANGFFHRFPGQVVGELSRLGQDLWNLGSWALKKLWDGLKSGASGIFGWLKGFAGGVVQIFKDVWHWFSPSGVMFQAGRDLMLGLEKGIQSRAHHAQSAFSHAVGNIGSGVQRWAPLVQQALRMEGLSPGLLGNVLFQMQTESGGNPNATNLTDMNAAMGDPSRGLMQTIMSTFLAYHWPGTSLNIFDPLANIAAALNYARHVYGPSLMSGGMGIGSGHGYDTGGWLPTGVSMAYNFTGRPERVLGPGEGLGGGLYVNVNVPPTVNPKEAGRQIAQLILAHTKAGGRLYPAGVTPR